MSDKETEQNSDTKDKDTVRVAATTEGSFAFSTGEKNHIRMTMIKPIIDAHMHIMSLNCTPLPLQWGTAYLRAGFFGKMMGKSRPEVTDLSAGRGDGIIGAAAPYFTHEFGEIGQFSTDIIAKIFMGNAENANFIAKLYWLLTDDDNKDVANKLKISLNDSSIDVSNEQSEAGKILDIEGHTEKRNQSFSQFVEATSYYYRNSAPFFMQFAMPMDMSYAHFWGLHDLPIYLPAVGENYFYFINDFYYIKNGTSAFVYDPLEYDIRKDAIDSLRQANLILHFNSSLAPHINSYHRQLLQAINNSAHDISTELPLLRFGSPKYLTDLFDEVKGWEVRKKQSVVETEPHKYFVYKEQIQEENAEYLFADAKKYKHYLMPIEAETTEMFEDYWEQVALHEAAMLQYPLQMIPFFHYDPRRYYREENPEEDVPDIKKPILDALIQNHAFFDISDTTDFRFDATDFLRTKPFGEFSDEESIRSLKNLKVKKSYIVLHDFRDAAEKRMPAAQGIDAIRNYFKDLFFTGLTPTSPFDIKNITHGTSLKMSHDDCVKTYLYPDGPFMGVKVYPPLGYPADISEQQGRFGFPSERFENYKELFRHCIKYHLPVMAHASPLGMSIADGHNYVLNDRAVYHSTTNPIVKRLAGKDLFDAKGAPLMGNPDAADCALYVDKLATHPDSWERFLANSEFSQLKLCMAHFGGTEAWIGKYKNEPEKDWRDSIINLICKFSNVYTDISNFNVESSLKYQSLPSDEFNKIQNQCHTSEEKKVFKDAYSREGGVFYYRHEQMFALLKVRMILRRYGQQKDDVWKVAAELAEKIKQNGKLRWRILMGSDWYMTEIAGNYPGKYYMRMFEILAEVTYQLGGEWDAWHQFSVINPLLFIGLLNSEDGLNIPEKTEEQTGLKYYEFRTVLPDNLDKPYQPEEHPDKIDHLVRLKIAYRNVRSKVGNPKWKDFARLPMETKEDTYDNLYDGNLRNLGKCRIYTAESVIRAEKLAILNIW